LLEVDGLYKGPVILVKVVQFVIHENWSRHVIGDRDVDVTDVLALTFVVITKNGNQFVKKRAVL